MEHRWTCLGLSAAARLRCRSVDGVEFAEAAAGA
jgi:hypothetical protein